MAEYRLYQLDVVSGHIRSVELIHGADDLSVICAVEESAQVAPMELWQGGRKVRRFDGRPPSPPPRVPAPLLGTSIEGQG